MNGKKQGSQGPTLLRLLTVLVLLAWVPACGGSSGRPNVDLNLPALLDRGNLTGPDAAARRTAFAEDLDFDGLPDTVEVQLGTDPELIDSDRDGLTDQYELWGCEGIAIGLYGSTDMTQLPDPNGNGIIAALDRGDAALETRSRTASAALEETRVRVSAPGDDPVPNDLDGDYIPSDFELAGFYYEIDPLTGEDFFVKWDGDIRRNYYKTDPTKWSSDADPWSDWEESTKRNMDQRVKKPGDHPCIPAYPKLEVQLTGFSIEDARDIEASNGRKTQSGWKSTVKSGTATESNWSVDGKVGVEASIGVGSESQSSLKVSVEATYARGGEETNTSTVEKEESGLTSEEWSTTTAGDTIQTARLLLNASVLNVGTMPISESKALFNLKLGEFSINSFVLSLTNNFGIGELKPRAENPLELVISNDGKETEGVSSLPLYLSLLQMQTLHLGAPLVIEPVSFNGQTLVSEVDPSTGRRVNLDIGPWAPYKSAIETVTAKVILDLGPDPEAEPLLVGSLPQRRTQETRVFAYDNTGSYVGSPPVVTLRDAFIWGFNARESALGPVVTINDPVSGQDITAYLNDYVFAFDQETFEYVVSSQQQIDNLLDLPILPSNPGERVYIAKAPPLVNIGAGIDESKPRVYWAQLNVYDQKRIPEFKPLRVTLNPPTFHDPPILVFSNYRYEPLFRPVVRAFVDDPFDVREVRFKPSPDSIGEIMTIGDDPGDPLSGMAYEYFVPEHYVWTGFETVVAINLDGTQSNPQPISLTEGTHYDVFGELQQGYQNAVVSGTETSKFESGGNEIGTNEFLDDLAAHFLQSGIRPGDRVVNRTQNTETVVVEVLSDTRILLNTGLWQDVPGVDSSQIGEQKFFVGDTYSIAPALARFETLGYFTGTEDFDIPISGIEFDNSSGSYGFSFSDPAAPRNPPFDILISESFGNPGTKTLAAVNAAGVAAIGAADWDTINYSTLRKATYSNSVNFYTEGVDPQPDSDHVFLVRLNEGYYVKIRMKFEAHAGAPGEVRVKDIDYQLYRGI